MCDIVPGELLLSFHERDVAAQALLEDIHVNRIEHVEVITTLSNRLFELGLKPRAGLNLVLCRLRVPEGQEAFKVNYLQFFYKHRLIEMLASGRMSPQSHGEVLGRSDYHPQFVPHSRLSVAGPVGFHFEAAHAQYKALMKVSTLAGTGKDMAIAVLDSGIDVTSLLTVHTQKNFVDSTKALAIDDYGHGTAVSTIIHDLCPDAQFIVYKVVDNQGTANEWDMLAALAAKTPAKIINMSLAFGLTSVVCPNCGRHPHQSRSAVFENLLGQVMATPDAPILVAAAGNAAASELAYPARFGDVVAIEAVNNSQHLSSFSNRSTTNEAGTRHANVFVAPGGEQAPALESIGQSTMLRSHWGTSYAAAYATALIGKLWSTPPYAGMDRVALLAHLKSRADRSFGSYDPTTYGNGFLRA